MGEMTVTERLRWFDAEVRAGAYPNAATLAAAFEISTKTAQRTIAFIRDRLAAPLLFDPPRHGYRYADPAFSLFAPRFSQHELLALLLAQKLLASSAGGVIGRSIRSFGRKLYATTSDGGFGEEQINEAFSAVWHGFTPVEGETFRLVAESLLLRNVLAFSYYVPGRDAWSERQVEPHHLQHYQGSWILLAWCRERRAWRKFQLGRMRDPLLLPLPFAARSEAEWRPLIDSAFGIFQGDELHLVELLFTPLRARWVRAEAWHPLQQGETHPDGSYLLRLPVNDFREIRQRILSHGSEVEVLAPLELRADIAAEIARMVERYRKHISP